MPQDWWGPVVQWTLWGLIMSVVMAWVARSRTRARPAAEQRTLRHPFSTLAIGLAGSVFFFGIAIISNTVGKNPTATVWTTTAFILFGLLFIPIMADYFLARHSVSDAGIDYGRMLGQRGKLRWPDIESVRYETFMKWFVLRSRDGTTVRVSAMLMGLP